MLRVTFHDARVGVVHELEDEAERPVFRERLREERAEHADPREPARRVLRHDTQRVRLAQQAPVRVADAHDGIAGFVQV